MTSLSLHSTHEQRHRVVEARLDGRVADMRDEEIAGSPRFGGKQFRDEDGGTASNNHNPPSRTEGRQEERLRAGVVPKYSRLEFPTYDGSEDPLVLVHCSE